jgi:arabinogalactan oligomer/maltooligosaccharide transport system permease protein
VELSDLRTALPPRRTLAGSLVASLGLLAAALLAAGLVGVLGYLALDRLLPRTPTWSGLVIGGASLIPILGYISRRFAWIMPWYYVLPAIVFLLTFTFFPVILTVWLAFTDYAGARNGALSIPSTTAVVEIDGARLRLSDPRNLACDQLSNGCNGVRARLTSSELVNVEVIEIVGTSLRLAQPLPSDRSLRQVDMYLPSLRFSFATTVLAVDGVEITLERAPPVEPDLARVRVQLSDEHMARIATLDGDWVILTAPPPAGFEPSAIARYNEYGFIGWRNFQTIIARAQRALLPVFAWNVSFALLTIVINTVFGVLLGVLLANPELRGRNLYRTLLIVPWALPNIITIQVWRGFLNENFGAINRLLMLFDVTADPINWLGMATAAKGAVLLVNLWLGLPFMMTAVLGALSAIPRELYEAARIDGASPWAAFWGVTAPLLRTALVPITLTSFAFNFNNFNLIFLLTDGGPPVDWGTSTARGTDILISWAYNEAFRTQGGFAYGLGSAISLMIFIITVAVSLVNFRVTGALKELDRT